ncbi:hypothetical protein YC2023_006863 [Brassica napus]
MFLSEVLSFVDKETSTALLVFVLKWNKNRIIDGNDDNEGGLGDKRHSDVRAGFLFCNRHKQYRFVIHLRLYFAAILLFSSLTAPYDHIIAPMDNM